MPSSILGKEGEIEAILEWQKEYPVKVLLELQITPKFCLAHAVARHCRLDLENKLQERRCLLNTQVYSGGETFLTFWIKGSAVRSVLVTMLSEGWGQKD